MKKQTKKILVPLAIGALLLGGLLLILNFPTSSPSSPPAQVQRVEEAPAVSVLPERIVQGDPIMVSISGSSTPTSITFDGAPLDTFLYNDRPSALIGVDLNERPGTSTIVVGYADGSTITKDLAIEERQKVTAPLGIPQKLGGNNPASVQALVTSLAAENAQLLAISTASEALWTEDFRYPVDDPVVTDDYGYTRLTGNQSISHKGTDFRAPEGTSIKAMNEGSVRLAKEFRNYGNTVVIDHGLGVQTFYMHLSRMDVKEGDVVEKGQVIGLSGQTGYAAMPHLHLTVRINKISIDPVVFLGLFEQ